jgi:ABC-type dipeptide/oligopeptide/nickel transport system ATPase component
MALNFEKVGRQICKVEGGKNDKKIVSIYVGKKEEVEDTFDSFKLTEGKFQQIPNPNKDQTEREILYITGCSGSGKSTYACNYIQCYKKKFPKNEVFLFSAISEDNSIAPVNPKRIVIDDSLITDPLKCEDFTNSIVVFDDIDCLSNKKHREEVYKILNSILETGRHYYVSCIITNHLPTAGYDTKRILNECHTITYFPHSSGGRGIKYLLTEYLGLNKPTMKRIKNANSRWATIFKNYPNVCLTEKEVFVIKDEY